MTVLGRVAFGIRFVSSVVVNSVVVNSVNRQLVNSSIRKFVTRQCHLFRKNVAMAPKNSRSSAVASSGSAA
jgi:hypothetical protein